MRIPIVSYWSIVTKQCINLSREGSVLIAGYSNTAQFCAFSYSVREQARSTNICARPFSVYLTCIPSLSHLFSQSRFLLFLRWWDWDTRTPTRLRIQSTTLPTWDFDLVKPSFRHIVFYLITLASSGKNFPRRFHNHILYLPNQDSFKGRGRTSIVSFCFSPKRP
jgi:hypothetical protein